MAGRLRLTPGGPHSASLIVPVIKGHVPSSDDVIDLPGDFSLISEALVGELKVFYAFDLPGHFEYVSEHDRRRLQLDPGELREQSVRNLAKRRSKPEILWPSATAAMLRLDGDLEASLLLHDSLWRHMAGLNSGETIVAVPSRDVVVVSGTEAAGGVETLHSAVKRCWDRPRDRKLLLTRSLLVRRHDSWHLLEQSS